MNAGQRPEPQRRTMLVLGGSTDPAEVAALCERLRAELEERPGAQPACDVTSITHPDLTNVDALARLQLTARRVHRRLRVLGAGPELRELVDLVGLAGLVSAAEDLRVEPVGETEERKQALGIQEEADPGDPVP
jgi:ABC-type transporter Mla MlaB component